MKIFDRIAEMLNMRHTHKSRVQLRLLENAKENSKTVSVKYRLPLSLKFDLARNYGFVIEDGKKIFKNGSN